jgi:hypothetical protein
MSKRDWLYEITEDEYRARCAEDDYFERDEPDMSQLGPRHAEGADSYWGNCGN